jgi:hypothetical protein
MIVQGEQQKDFIETLIVQKLLSQKEYNPLQQMDLLLETQEKLIVTAFHM